jgi:cytoskeletal protein RodZ
MKRCPQCSFLYLDSDELCDLDQTPLLADDFDTDPGVIPSSEQKAEKPLPTAAASKPKRKRKLNPKTLLAAVVAGLIIGLTVLLVYQRMRPTLQASPSAPTSQAQTAQASRVSQVAQQASNEVAARPELASQELEFSDAPDDHTSPSVEASPSVTAKAAPNTPPDSARVRVSSNPVSTGDVTSGRGPVTVRLANGTTLEADEVWRTKAGIWYRRKGIVTFIKPHRVRQ